MRLTTNAAAFSAHLSESLGFPFFMRVYDALAWLDVLSVFHLCMPSLKRLRSLIFFFVFCFSRHDRGYCLWHATGVAHVLLDALFS